MWLSNQYRTHSHVKTYVCYWSLCCSIVLHEEEPKADCTGLTVSFWYLNSNQGTIGLEAFKDMLSHTITNPLPSFDEHFDFPEAEVTLYYSVMIEYPLHLCISRQSLLLYCCPSLFTVSFLYLGHSSVTGHGQWFSYANGEQSEAQSLNNDVYVTS